MFISWKGLPGFPLHVMVALTFLPIPYKLIMSIEVELTKFKAYEFNVKTWFGVMQWYRHPILVVLLRRKVVQV